MNFKLITAFVVMIPFMVNASDTEICLGDTYEKVKEVKGFPKQVSYTHMTSKIDEKEEVSSFEAVTFYKDDTIYIFESSNSRLCRLSTIKNEKNLVCKKSFKSSQCA